ncbi:hypothetical protein ACFP3Q_17045 [Nocardioides sp. GCM10027113]|uniref:hypothetical protein n=1 Tax=Nocardioides sp. GCM10027113 TaxID=3273405 RepID=UPI00360E3C97
MTAADISAMSKRNGGNEPLDVHLEAALAWLEPDEELLWCVDYADMEQKFGPSCMLLVTPRRLVVQRLEGLTARKPTIYEVAMEEVLVAIDFPKPVMFGLMKNHHLVVQARPGRIVLQDLRDEQVAAAVEVINAAAVDAG